MDWTNWVPRERANLCFILRGNQVLLIRKKRGLGAGKINAPGGKIEPGETPLEAVIRETQEEILVTPLNVREAGVLSFQFADGYSLYCHVYIAQSCDGTPTETEEAAPFWVDLDAIPYGEMWPDDVHWLPLALAGQCFLGFFELEGETLIRHRIELVDSCPAS